MKIEFKQRLKKLIFWLVLLFVILFVFRLAYGYSKNEAMDAADEPRLETYYNNTSNELKKNYASTKFKIANQQGQITTSVDQKYEKVASIQSKSSKFEQEEKTIRSQIKSDNAIIQYEQKNGNAGARNLSLVIGVPPTNFDKLYNSLIKIGNVERKQITKTDKTNEYKELNAKKESLEKIRTSLLDLKSKGGKIEEYMNLENRILEIEGELQNLGVSLGDFDNENEFCTIQFSLTEGHEVKISLLHRIKVALIWTIDTYYHLILTFTFIVAFSFFLLLTIEKLKLLERILKK